MAAKFICDGCGKEAKANYSTTGQAIKPKPWYVRCDEDGPQHACCRECVEKISEKSGKTGLVLPI